MPAWRSRLPSSSGWLFDSEYGPRTACCRAGFSCAASASSTSPPSSRCFSRFADSSAPTAFSPAGDYLQAVARQFGGPARSGLRPPCSGFPAANHMLMAQSAGSGCWHRCCLVANVWPRGTLFVCFVCFLSFVAAAQDFSGYQSDGMLLEAGFISPVLRAAGIFARAGARASAVARQPVPAAVGVVPHLLRVGRGEAGQRRSASGATSPPWTSTTRTARCPPGLAGTCSICRTGSTPSPPAQRW